MANAPKLNVDIRELELTDIVQVFELGQELFTADRWTYLYRTWDEYDVLHAYISDRQTSLVADLDGEIIGFALGTLIEKPRTAWTYGYLVWFGVSEKFRGQGVAKKLLRRFTEQCIEAGARMMLVDTDAENEDAIAFFEKNGFGHHQPHVYMSRNLSKHPAYEKHREEEKRK